MKLINANKKGGGQNIVSWRFAVRTRYNFGFQFQNFGFGFLTENDKNLLLRTAY